MADMCILQEEHPDIFEKESASTPFILERASTSFIALLTLKNILAEFGPGIEQSGNRDSGTPGGLTALKTNKAAMDCWYLTEHLKANVASAFFSMLRLYDGNQSSAHKESMISVTR